MDAFRLTTVAALAAAAALAQPAPRRTFEVASIKAVTPNPNNRPAFPQFLPGGRFTMSGLPVRFVIALAWNIGFQSVRLSAGPEWISSFENGFEIDAKAPEGAVPVTLPANIRDQRIRQMLQALLEDRFKLKIHAESKELPVYAVTIGKSGVKMQKSDIDEKDCPAEGDMGVTCHSLTGGRGRGLHGKAVALEDILSFVENWTDRPFLDQTGLHGLYKVDTRGWVEAPPGQEPAPGAKTEDGSSAADAPTLFNIFESMGLKLTAQKGTAQIYVIDHIERPTVN
jgi:uncharacterized protein (TIGR03435 family)